MIHLDARTGEKDKILDLLRHSIDNPELELECLINNSNNRSNPNITYDNFIAIIKRFKGRPDFEATTSLRLAVSFPENTKYKNTRVLIKGGAVNSYCNNENLSLIRNNIDFEEKTKASFKNSHGQGQAQTFLTNVKIPNYDIKFNLKQEKSFNNDEARINELIRDWNELKKNYRYKKIFSFKKKTGDFQIDVSIVKSSISINNRYITVKEVKENNYYGFVVPPPESKMNFKNWWKTVEDKPNENVMISNAPNFYSNIKESAVFTNIPTYEVEVEYIKNKTTNKPKFKNITDRNAYVQEEFVNFFKHIGAVLQCVQGSLYLISNDEKYNVKRKFIKVVEDSITEKMVERQASQKRKYGGHGHGGHGGQAGYKMKGGADRHESLGYDIGDIKDRQRNIVMDSDNELNFNANIDSENDMPKILGGGGKKTDEGNDRGSGSDTESGTEGKDSGEGSGDSGEEDDVEGNMDVEGGMGTKKERTQLGGARMVAELKYKVSESLKKNIFFGPLIIDLLLNNAIPLDRRAIPDTKTNTNIHINYLVTDKADGDRNLLFFDDEGRAFGIDRKKTIKYYGVTMPSLANSILDGEYISRSEDDKILNNFYLFDAYIYKGENVMIKPFLFNRQTGRHHCIMESAKYASTGHNIIQSNVKLPFMLYKKEYLPSNSPDSYESLRDGERPLISENCEKLLNRMNIKYGGNLELGHLYSYKTDGLIFLPNNLSIYQTYEGEHIANPFYSGRWNNNYKWKPADHLTIDFKVEFVKEMGSSRLAYKYFGTNQKYLHVNLISAVYQSKNPKSIDNNKLNFYLLNSGLKIQSIPQEFKFFATDPFVGTYTEDGELQNNMGEAYFEVDGNDNIVCGNGQFLTDGVICECSYTTSADIKDDLFRWRPERLRTDKESPNMYGTAVTTWSLINKPITKELLSGLGRIGGGSGSDGSSDGVVAEGMSSGVASEGMSLETIAYFAGAKKTTKLTAPMNNFTKGSYRIY